ncbi:hypothetical protein [Hymenobacter bucti]|uniref:Uncharacterized protein n=1 Tax=Hymenobacter bucti TaxID=1844114 RepID=A0ABW4QXV3_9BACT
MATSKRWIITTSGEQPLPAIERRLAAAGFVVEQVLTEIGCITGTAPEDAAEQARAIPGVADVSPEGPPITIGPPDALIT